MWQQFTEWARRVVFFAQEEAQKCGVNFVAPEHLLAGLLREEDCVAHRVLLRLNVEPARLCEELAALLPKEPLDSDAAMQLSPRCKLVIDCAYDEARQLNNNFIGTEHLLLGLLRGDESLPLTARLRKTIVGETKHLALQTLEQHGVTLEAARSEVRKLQDIDELRASSAPHDSDTELRAAQPPSSVDSATELRASAPANEQTPEEKDGMWQRFTERARRVVFFAQEEAGRLGENYVSTEHLLLGLVRENDSVAARILDRMGISLGRIRSETERQVTRGDGRLGQDMQLTPRAKRVIDLAYDEARQLSNNYIGTEHLLLGLIREGEGLAGRVLTKLGVELITTREVVVSLQENDSESNPPQASRRPPYTAPVPGMAPSEMLEIAQLKLFIEANDSWRKKSLISLRNVSIDEFRAVLVVAAGLKKYDLKRQPSIYWQYPRTLALVFEKPSLRTRVSFEVAMTHLRGQAIYLAPGDVGLGTREAVPDVAGALSRWVDILAARVFKHETVEELALHATIPVINALSEREHPIQAFADLLTVQEQKGPLGNHLTLAYVGDGNNVLNALLLACAKMGVHVRAGCPEGYGPDAAYVDEARRIGKEDGTGATVTLTADPAEAVRDADVLYTDVWASMGQESEREERARLFAPYQVNAALVAHAKPDAIVLHDLPAHRGEEITDDIMERFKTSIFDQAENRLHTQKALLALIIGL